MPIISNKKQAKYIKIHISIYYLATYMITISF